MPQKEDVMQRLKVNKLGELEKGHFWDDLFRLLSLIGITKGMLSTTTIYCAFFFIYYIIVIAPYNLLAFFPLMISWVITSSLLTNPSLLEVIVIEGSILLGGLLLIGFPILPFALIKGWKGEKGTNLNLSLMATVTIGLFITFTFFHSAITGRVFQGLNISEGKYTLTVLGQSILYGLLLSVWINLLGKIGMKVGQMLEKTFR